MFTTSLAKKVFVEVFLDRYTLRVNFRLTSKWQPKEVGVNMQTGYSSLSFIESEGGRFL